MKHFILLAALCWLLLQDSIPTKYRAFSITKSKRGQRFALQPTLPYDATAFVGKKEIRIDETWFHIDSLLVWDSTSINYFTRQEDRFECKTIVSIAKRKDTVGVWQIVLVWDDSIKMIQAVEQ